MEGRREYRFGDELANWDFYGYKKEEKDKLTEKDLNEIAHLLCLCGDVVQKLSLFVQPLGNQGGVALNSALSRAPNLAYLRMAFCDLNPEAIASLSSSLSSLSSLSTLDLSGNDIENKGVSLLCSSLNSTNITTLRLQNNMIGIEGVKVLMETISENKNLLNLSLDGNDFGNEGATFIAQKLLFKNCQLTELHLEHTDLGGVGGEELGRALEQNNTLTQLHLGWNRASDKSIFSLSRSLKKNTSLLILGLENNEISDIGASELACALEENRTLQSLSLSQNLIGNEGGKKLSKMLKNNCFLQSFEIDNNRMTKEGVSQFLKTIGPRNTTLDFLLVDHIEEEELTDFLSKKKEIWRLCLENSSKKKSFFSFLPNLYAIENLIDLLTNDIIFNLK